MDLRRCCPSAVAQVAPRESHAGGDFPKALGEGALGQASATTNTEHRWRPRGAETGAQLPLGELEGSAAR
eukprot:2601719-Alexandrium_andersonii.AAC.1